MPARDRKLTVDELGRPTSQEHHAATKTRVVVVLDDIRSRHNVGAIFRTADAFGVERLILCGFTPLPPHREIEKTALGATHSVPWQAVEDAPSAVRALQAEGYKVWAVEQTMAAVSLELMDPLHGPMALVFGNEVNGVSEGVIELCDGCIVVPQRGSKHSLNVSVCAGVVLWQLAGRPA